MPRVRASHGVAPGHRSRGRPVGERLRGGSARRRWRRGRRPSPAPRRLGAAESPQRRFDGARTAVARRVGAVDGRHREGGRAGDRPGDSGGAPAGAEDPASRQPDVERAGIPAGGAAPRRRRQRRPKQSLRPSRAGGAGALHAPPARRSSAPIETARSRSTATATRSMCARSRAGIFRCTEATDEHEHERHETRDTTEGKVSTHKTQD